MRIAVYGKKNNADFRPQIEILFKRFKEEQVQVFLYEPFFKYYSEQINLEDSQLNLFSDPKSAPSNIDFLMSIGGDGTFLESMLYLKSSEIPVIGINSGRLGYLASIGKDNLDDALDAIFERKFDFEYRTLLRAEYEEPILDGYNFALNEITVQKIDSSLITVNAWVDDVFVNTYWTDGLIIATPTGSTAYSLSVGGPIIVPGTENFTIAPIASHNLSVRPIVISDSSVIKLEVLARTGAYLVTADNRKQQLSTKQTALKIRKSKFRLKLLKLPFNDYYSTLRNKLLWGFDKRN